MSDHMSSTFGGDEDIGTLKGENFVEIYQNPKELEHFEDVTSGYAHRKFLDRDGNRIPKEDEDQFYRAVTTGVARCGRCNNLCPNHLRLSEHIVNDHVDDEDRVKKAQKFIEWCKEIETKYF